MWTTRKRGLQVFDVVQVRSGARVVTDSSRDARLTVFGKATLADRYLLPGEGPQDMFARVAMTYADDSDHAQRLYDYISRLWFMPATPVLSNGGTSRGLPISCFLNECSDSLNGIAPNLQPQVNCAIQCADPTRGRCGGASATAAKQSHRAAVSAPAPRPRRRPR